MVEIPWRWLRGYFYSCDLFSVLINANLHSSVIFIMQSWTEARLIYVRQIKDILNVGLNKVFL
ncbi:hypothetical protein PEC301899_21940 [Pectobacterium carotovorum subsp. carotovorum]|nr:hypothetical protein PEC301899_21940 [Pectobacterium carotovorum subsp. carotovorum]